MKLNPPVHYGNVGLGASAKQTEAALIVRCALMKSATGGLMHESDAALLTRCTSSPEPPFQKGVPPVVSGPRGLTSHHAEGVGGLSESVGFSLFVFLYRGAFFPIV